MKRARVASDRLAWDRLVVGFLTASFVLVLAACGSSDGSDDDSAGRFVPGGPVDIKLTVAVDLGGGFSRAGTLECGNKPLGTGFLGGAGNSTRACRLMATDGDARKRLLQGPDLGRACTEQFGGPQVATVSGEIDKQRINTSIDRVNGCGIADWTLLEDLIGPPSA